MTPFEIVDPPTFEFGSERTVLVTQLPHVIVSTVRLGIDHGYGGVPLWYETMVFAHDGTDITNWNELDSERYTTESEARAGHAEVVTRWRTRSGTTAVWEDDDA